MTGDWVLACRADQACIEEREEVDIIDEAGDGIGLGAFWNQSR